MIGSWAGRRGIRVAVRAMIGALGVVHPAHASTGAVIAWDTYGIPHIYGPDLLTVVRGLGYAEMENHAETLLGNIANARGRSAEYFGAGANGANLANDIQVRTENIPARAIDWLARGGLFQSAVIGAFAAGVNEYAARHGDTIDPSFRRVLPFVPTDVTADEQNTVHFTFMPEQDNLPALISAWQTGGITAANALARSFTPGGSNGWAIAPSKSATGNAILMGNPHLPWGNNQPVPGLGLYQWMEANLVIGDPAAPGGDPPRGGFLGGAVLGIGFNDDLGWTHTNNTIQNTNLYQVTLNADGTYDFGGGTRPLDHRADIVKVRASDGSLQSQTIDIYATVQGPLVARNGTKALALRVAGLDQPSLVTQYWGMIASHNLGEFILANSFLQMPFFNVIYADRDGHVMYVFGGRQPVRRGGVWGDYAGILDGSDPTLVWSTTLDWLELPRAIDPPGGFVANSNDPPWTSSFPEVPTDDPANFAAWISPQLMDMRPQHGSRFLLSQAKFTTDQILSGKEQTGMLLADRVLPDLLLAATASGNRTAAAAAAVLAAWDHTADATAKGAVLFERWWDIVSQDPAIAKDDTINFYSPHPKFRVGWSASQPLDTPTGLADAASCVPDLVEAAGQVQAEYGALDVAWGDVHRTVLVTHDATLQTAIPLSNDPESGPDDPFGPIRVVNPFPAPNGTSDLWSYGGDGYVQLVEFTPQGAKARVLLGYGNASRPGSPHVTDQLPAFNAKTLLPAWRTQHEVAQHTVSVEEY